MTTHWGKGPWKATAWCCLLCPICCVDLEEGFWICLCFSSLSSLLPIFHNVLPGGFIKYSSIPLMKIFNDFPFQSAPDLPSWFPGARLSSLPYPPFSAHCNQFLPLCLVWADCISSFCYCICYNSAFSPRSHCPVTCPSPPSLPPSGPCCLFSTLWPSVDTSAQQPAHWIVVWFFL